MQLGTVVDGQMGKKGAGFLCAKRMYAEEELTRQLLSLLDDL